MTLTGDPTIDQALSAPLAELKRKRKWYVMGVALCAVLPLVAIAALVTLRIAPPIAVITVFAAIIGFNALTARFRRRVTDIVMPTVVQAVGMRYSGEAYGVGGLIDIGLLPSRRVKRAEDHITGEFDGRRLEMVDVEITTTGKNKRTLFNGLVVSFENKQREDWLLLGLEADTKPFLFSGPNLGLKNLNEVTRVRSRANEYLVFMADAMREIDTPLQTYLDGLMELDGLQGSKLYSIVRTYDQTHIALSLPRDSFSVGGIFSSDESLQRDIQFVLKELNIPLKVAQKLLDIETP